MRGAVVVVVDGGGVRGRILLRRVDAHLVEVAQRALGEDGEDADALDLVAEQLEAQRLAAGGREDVDDVAAGGELAALLHGAGHALVAGGDEGRHEVVALDLVADGAARTDAGRRSRGHEALDDGRGRDRHDAAAGQGVEGPRALADDVRRRLEAGAPLQAAAGR